MLDHYYYRRWYRNTTRTDFCCFHLQLNRHLAALLPSCSTTSIKKELPVVEYMDQGYVVTCAPNARDLRTRQLPCQYAYGQTRIRANTPTDRQEFVPIRLRIRPRCWHYTATRTTPSLVPYSYLHRQLIVPIRIQFTTDQLIMPICLQSQLLLCQ